MREVILCIVKWCGVTRSALPSTPHTHGSRVKREPPLIGLLFSTLESEVCGLISIHSAKRGNGKHTPGAPRPGSTPRPGPGRERPKHKAVWSSGLAMPTEPPGLQPGPRRARARAGAWCVDAAGRRFRSTRATIIQPALVSPKPQSASRLVAVQALRALPLAHPLRLPGCHLAAPSDTKEESCG